MPVTQTITGTVGSVSLTSSQFADPVTIAAGALVGSDDRLLTGVVINSTYAWTIDNAGTVDGGYLLLYSGPGYGTGFGAGSNEVINEAGGYISKAQLHTERSQDASHVDNSGEFVNLNIENNGSVVNEAGGTVNELSAIGYEYGTNTFSLTNTGYVNNLQIQNQEFSIVNSGTIGPVQTQGGGTIDNTGRLDGSVVQTYSSRDRTDAPISITNTGEITPELSTGASEDGVSLLSPTTLYNGPAASIIGEHYGIYGSGKYDVAVAYDHRPAEFIIENAGTINGGLDAVKLSGSIGNEVIIDPGALFLGDVVADTASANSLVLNAGSKAGTLDGLGSSYLGFQNITLAASSTWVIEGTVAGVDQSTIHGFASTDSLDLTDLTFSSGEQASFNEAAGILSIESESGSTLATVALAGETGTPTFSVQGDGGSGTDILLCYLRGTRILTPTGERPVEDLRIGHMVVTRWQGIQPIRWIGRQSYASRFIKGNRGQVPVRIKAGALADRTPARDLFVSPAHSMLLDGNLVLASSLVNGITITQDFGGEEVRYYQLELAMHECILAESAWSETYADGDSLRNQFHNVREFYELYPDHRSPEEPALCAPRPLRGSKLADCLRPVVSRASNGLKPGRLRGYVDLLPTAWKIEGWAHDEDHPELPVLLEILLEGQTIGTVLASDHRIDLDHAGIGHGCCGFAFTSPIKLKPSMLDLLCVRRVSDGAELTMTEICHSHAQVSLIHPGHPETIVGHRLAPRSKIRTG